jgi:hypothetical protein
MLLQCINGHLYVNFQLGKTNILLKPPVMSGGYTGGSGIFRDVL